MYITGALESFKVYCNEFKYVMERSQQFQTSTGRVVEFEMLNDMKDVYAIRCDVVYELSCDYEKRMLVSEHR